MKKYRLLLLLTVTLILSYTGFGSELDCKTGILPKLSGRQELYRDTTSLLTAENGFVQTGAVYKRWDPELETPIYSTMTSPRPDGTVPLVGKDAKAVLIFFHGSGTAKASGKNFKDTQNILRPFGIAGVSLDLPFHGENKGSEKLKNMDHFMDWIHQFVQKVKKEADQTGKKIPIYMMGHSFGPSVIQEYVERYPDDIADFLLMSPAGDFHPALKYTYEKITTPGEKYLEGEPVIPNDAGGEWAGQLEGQFTWQKKKSFDRVPGRMLLGELDEWWPGNKELARKVGVAQPYELDQPLKYLRRKYPQMKITTIPGVGHMLFEANAPDGENWVRKSILDMIGIPEKDRNVNAVPVLPAEKVALLYQTSPSFREWLGNKYRHSFKDPERAARVLKDWENQKMSAWKQTLERLPNEYPEFVKARGYSWTQAVKKSKLTGNSISDTGPNLQKDLLDYLSGSQEQRAAILSKEDPETPKPLKVASALLDKGWSATKNGSTGPLLRKAFEARIQGRGATNINTNEIGPKVFELTYEIEGQTYKNIVLDYTEAELNDKVTQLYRRAHEENNFESPGDSVEILDNGLKWKFNAKDRFNVPSLQVTK